MVAIPSMGFMARELNKSLFGVAMLIWALIGYAGIFDAGLGRAVVRHISVYAHRTETHGRILCSAVIFVMASGVLAGALIFIFSTHLTLHLFNVEEQMVSESVRGLYLAAFCVPFFLVSIIMQSYLEGLEQFRIYNIQRTVSGVAVYLFPVIGLYCNGSFTMLIGGLLAARIFSMLMVAGIVLKKCPLRVWKFDTKILSEMIRFGGWLTVTNIVSPFMVYMDRFIVAKIAGANAVAFYTAPGELVNRMSILPVSITRAIFPRMAALQDSIENANAMRRKAFMYAAGLILPFVLVVFCLAPFLIKIWLGEGYVEHSTPILRVMLIGFLLNSLSLIYYTNLQAKGLSNLTAKIHLCEIIPYLLLLVIAINYYGIFGSALAWSCRMFLDFFLMQYFDSESNKNKFKWQL